MFQLFPLTFSVFSVHKNVLRAGPLPNGQMLDVKLVGKKSSQGIGLAVSPYDSSLIFSPLTETAIASWNPSNNQQAVLAHDRDRLQFVADITTTRAEPGVIYAISSKFHRFFLKNLNPNEFNNRIVRLELPQARQQTAIKSPTFVHTGLALPTATAHNSLLHFGIYNSHSQSHVQAAQSTANALQTYFTSPALTTPLTTKIPYKFETTGIVNYGVRNPFTALNQGEAFPPTKATRDNYQRSYLDTLVDTNVPTVAAAASTSPYRGRNSGYYYP